MAVRDSPRLEVYFLKRHVHEENVGYAMLEEHKPDTRRYPARYLYQQAVTGKNPYLEFRKHLFAYIRAYNGVNENRVIQYHQLDRTVYLTGHYFSLGLRQVGPNVYHKITILGNNIPVHLFTCKEESKRHFLPHVNANKAVVSEYLITKHFDNTSDFILRPGTIYFFYTISHCLFAVEECERESYADMSRAVVAVNPMTLADFVENLMRNLPDSSRDMEIMRSEIIEVVDDDSIEEGTAVDIDELKDNIVALKFAVADRDDEIARLKEELHKRRAYEDVIQQLQQRIKDLEEDRDRITKQADDAKKDLEQKYKSKIKSIELQHEDRTSELNERIQQLEVIEEKYRNSKGQISLALDILQAENEDSDMASE